MGLWQWMWDAEQDDRLRSLEQRRPRDPRVGDVKAEVAQLRTDVNYLALIVKGMVRTMQKKGQIDMNEFSDLLRQIDAADGKEDAGTDPMGTLL